MSSSAPVAPELSNSQRKKLAAAAFNAAREQSTTIPCNRCKKIVTFKPCECPRDGINILVRCNACGHTMRLYRKVR